MASRPSPRKGSTATGSSAGSVAVPARPPVVRATPEEIAAHEAALTAYEKMSDGVRQLFRDLPDHLIE